MKSASRKVYIGESEDVLAATITIEYSQSLVTDLIAEGTAMEAAESLGKLLAEELNREKHN